MNAIDGMSKKEKIALGYTPTHLLIYFPIYGDPGRHVFKDACEEECPTGTQGSRCWAGTLLNYAICHPSSIGSTIVCL